MNCKLTDEQKFVDIALTDRGTLLSLPARDVSMDVTA